jgi:glycosyltransferase involved in cell wall biosynthesis
MDCTELTNKLKATQISRLADKRPRRILHVVGSMNRGGVETWLMHILRHIDRDRFQMDFLVHTNQPCAYDDEILALGSKIISCLHPKTRPWLYAHNFKRILSDYGPYDIVHSHEHHFSGYVLRIAKKAGVPVRIAHSHNDTSLVEKKARFLRRLYLGLTEWLICRNATRGIGCSRNAAADLFGPNWEKDYRWQLLHCGIDLTPFQNPVDRVTVRSELGIPASAFVVGHVGRFDPQKNHMFLLEILTEVAKREPRMHLLLIGVGSLHSVIEQKVIQLGLTDRVIFAGSRPDVPRLMRGAMDVFLFPSLYEGLGIVLVEAQAAGLPCIFSDVVPEEADVVKPLVRRISLLQPASVWAEAILTTQGNALAFSQTEALAIIENSSFNIEIGVKNLAEMYDNNISNN